MLTDIQAAITSPPLFVQGLSQVRMPPIMRLLNELIQQIVLVSAL